MDRVESGVGSPQAWLPADTIAERLPHATLGSVVDQWSADWFPSARARTGTWTAVRGTGDDLVLAVGGKGSEALADAMFGGAPDTATAADRACLAGAADACAEDLRRRLADVFGPAAASEREHRRRGCPIDLPGAPGALHLFLSDALLARWIRATLPPPPPRPPVQPFLRALEPQSIRLSALVGRCRLSLRDLENWAVGDVLVLDRPVDAALDLVIGGALRTDAPCRLVDAGDELHLVLS